MLRNTSHRLCLAVALLSLPLHAFAQPFQPGQFPQGGTATPLSMVGSQSNRILQQAIKLAADGDYAQALPTMQMLLDQSEDSLIFSAKDRKLISFRQHVESTLATFPADGLEQYELVQGAKARELFQQGKASGSPDTIVEVSRRFFHTKAGLQATKWLAAYLFDHATPLAAGRMFERARSHLRCGQQQRLRLGIRTAVCWHFAGNESKSRQLIDELVKESPSAEVSFGGRRLQLPNAAEDAEKWLADLVRQAAKMGAQKPQSEWHFAGGNQTRTATANSGMPYLGALWSQPLTEPVGDTYEAQQEVLTQKLQRQIEALRLERLGMKSNAPTPASRPLVVNNTVVVRALGAVRAFDLQTGRHLWDTSEIDNEVAQAIASVVDAGMTDVSFQKIGSLVDDRTWQNANMNGLSSDGETIYTLYGFTRNSADPFGRVDVAAQNMLMAIDLSSGRLKWELGGPPATEKILNGHYMSGAPLPVQDALTGRSRKSLFALTETSGGIQAVAIDPDSNGGPRLVWSQTIHTPNIPIEMSRVRQSANLSPSYSEGILVCPTNAGAVVAIDLSTRRIMWSHSYETRQLRATARRIVIRNGRRVVESAEDSMLGRGPWQESNAVIKNGKVFVTPRDSELMLRLDLLTGVADVPISVVHGMFIAAVTDSHAVVVTRQAIRGIHHKDATQNWTTPIDPPTGRGFQVGNDYILPIEGNKVIRLELATGAIRATATSTDGVRPGNLWGAGPVVVSHNGATVSAYRTRAVMEALAKSANQLPPNPDALFARGELAIADGNLKQGVADLKMAYQLDPDERNRQMLVRAFFVGLESDFAEFVQHAPGMKATLKTDAENFTYHRHLAAGYASSKQPVKAFNSYMHLAEFASDVSVDEMMPQADSGHSVRMDRWLSRRLGQLHDTQIAEHRADMDAALLSFVNRLAKSKNSSKLQRAARILGPLGSIDLHRAAAESIIPASKNPIALELHLREIEQRLAADAQAVNQQSTANLSAAERTQHAAFVTARRVELAVQSGDVASFAASVNRLRTEFGDVVIWNGKTGRELAKGIDVSARTSPHAWPTDEIEVIESDRDDDVFATSIVRFDGSRGPVFRDRALMFMGMRAEFVALDGFGQPLWRFRGGHRDNLFSVSALGHLLVIKSSNQVHALDTFGATKTGSPSVQWHIDFNPTNQLNQFRRNDFFDEENRLALNSNTAFFLRKSELVAVDLLKGERVWSRKDMQDIQGDQQQLFADDEHLIVYQANTGKLQVFRSIDGSKLKESELSGRPWFTMVGTKALYPNSLRLVDQVSFETVWQGKFDPTSITALVDDDHCAVLEPGGRFAVVNMHDGSIKLESQFGKIGSIKRLFVRRSEDRLIAIVDSGLRTPGGGGLDDDGEHGGMFGVVVYGQAVCVDVSGKVLWRRPLNGQILTPPIAKDIPLLVFAGEVRAPSNGPRPTLASSLPVLCIDTRDGQVLYRQVDDHRTDGRKPNTSRYQLSVGSKPNEIVLDLSGKRIEFRFRKDASD